MLKSFFMVSPKCQQMRLSINEPLSNDHGVFFQWDFTSELIVVHLMNRETHSNILQARNWDGKQLWQTQIAESPHWGLAIGDNFVFLGSNSGEILEFHLSSGW